MNILKRLKQLECCITITQKGYETTLSDVEKLEFRTLNEIKNILTSQAKGSFMSADTLRYLLKQLKWDGKDFKRGKFFYDEKIV